MGREEEFVDRPAARPASAGIDGAEMDTEIYGRPNISWLTRRCQFVKHGVECGFELEFPSEPEHMPACADPGGLGSHDFVW